MKKNLIFGLITVGLIATFIFNSCASDNDQEKELKLSNMNFDNMKIDINFNDIEDNVNVNVNSATLSNKVNAVYKEIAKINLQIDDSFKKDKSLKEVEYSITITPTNILIDNWKFKSKDARAVKSGEGTFLFQCPPGQSLVANCWSESCVKGALTKALKSLSSGDTVNITVHHGGMTGGVSICAS
jgi:hypothetical protein